MGIHRGNLALGHPLFQNAGLFVNQAFQRGLEELLDGGGAMQDLVGKETRCFRPFGRHGKLARDVAPDLRHGVAAWVDVGKGLQPAGQGFLQNRDIDVLLALEVIEQVGLGHAGAFGNLVNGGATETIGGKHFERRIQDNPAVHLLNAGGLARGIPLLAQSEVHGPA